MDPREALGIGDVIQIGTRQVVIQADHRDTTTICRDQRRRIAVRNVVTNRLSYIPEWRLVKAKATRPKQTRAKVAAKLASDYGFKPCTHPDCGKDGNCASNAFHKRATALAYRALGMRTSR